MKPPRNQKSMTVKRMDNISVLRKGFTLVELLVVIGIVALLVSILLPGLNQAREQAKGVVCQVNLRSIGSAIFIYHAQYDDAMPLLYERSYWAPNITDPATDNRGNTWPDCC